MKHVVTLFFFICPKVNRLNLWKEQKKYIVDRDCESKRTIENHRVKTA